MDEWWRKDDFERISKEVVVAWLRYYLGIFLSDWVKLPNNSVEYEVPDRDSIPDTKKHILQSGIKIERHV